ncbi:MAG: hypothetical protein EBQ95_08320 [Gammaproteobacteria bacterium]|nr:hypothetical protein [Gammaproteobacteria bacterium]
MRNTFIFFLLNILLVNIGFSENEPVLTCPKSIICGHSDECKLSDNPYNSWGPPINTKKKSRGTYKLIGTRISSNDLGRPACTYYKEGSRDWITVVFGYTQEKPNYFLPMSYFKPTSTNWSEQTDQDYQKSYFCNSDDPWSCSMI